MRKEDQGIRDAGQISRVPGFFVVHFSFFVVPGRGVLNMPHKTARQGRIQDGGKGQIFTVRRISHRGRGRCPLTPTSFSCLDTGKRKRKENQGLTEAGEFGRVPGFFVVHFSFFVVPGRGVLHTPHKRPEWGGCMMMGRAKFCRQVHST